MAQRQKAVEPGALTTHYGNGLAVVRQPSSNASMRSAVVARRKSRGQRRSSYGMPRGGSTASWQSHSSPMGSIIVRPDFSNRASGRGKLNKKKPDATQVETAVFGPTRMAFGSPQ